MRELCVHIYSVLILLTYSQECEQVSAKNKKYKGNVSKNASWVTSDYKTKHFWPEWGDRGQHTRVQGGLRHLGQYTTDGCGPSSTWHRRHPGTWLRYGRLHLPALDHQVGAAWKGKEEDQVTAHYITKSTHWICFLHPCSKHNYLTFYFSCSFKTHFSPLQIFTFWYSTLLWRIPVLTSHSCPDTWIYTWLVRALKTSYYKCINYTDLTITLKIQKSTVQKNKRQVKHQRL